ncbi:MAG: EamA family transporter [Chloroflexi bacterium]|nr:EamA family transporter [Chloroflexota bacterium]
MQSERLRGYGLALVAAGLWATLGLFYHKLQSYGLPRLTIAFFRATVTALILFPLLKWRQPSWLRIKRRDWPLFTALGLFGVAAFFVVYIYAIDLTGMGVAAVLMYTAPAWVTLISAIFFQEQLDGLKVSVLLLACAGCALVGRVYDLDNVRLNLWGILAGLGAGLTYGLYTIFSKVAQRHYTSWGTLAYALGLGGLFMLPLQSRNDIIQALTSTKVLFWLSMLGLIPTLVGGIAFNAALRRIPASDASIIATFEPVIAALLGWAFLKEQMETLQLLGAGLILIAVAILQKETTANHPNRDETSSYQKQEHSL